MHGPFEPWRRHVVLWSVPLAFCLLNVIGLVVFQGAFAGNVDGLQEVHDEAAKDLETLRTERRRTEDLLQRINGSRENIQKLKTENFGTEAERFTDAIREVKSLARKAGLNPESFSYPQNSLEFGLRQRNFAFSVAGTYEQLRLFINYLELSDQFLTLESITLSEAGDGSNNPKLGIRFDLSTIFLEPRGADASGGGSSS